MLSEGSILEMTKFQHDKSVGISLELSSDGT